MVSQLQSATVSSYTNAVDIRLGAQRPIYRVASRVPAGIALQALATNGARPWPEKVGATTWISASCRVLCIGPAEWLAIGCEAGPAVSAVAPLAVVDLTEGFAHIELVGEAVQELLTSVCGLDVHLAAFAPDTCARTRFAGVAVVLDRRGPEAFACYAPRSYLNYLLAALRRSAGWPDERPLPSKTRSSEQCDLIHPVCCHSAPRLLCLCKGTAGGVVATAKRASIDIDPSHGFF